MISKQEAIDIAHTYVTGNIIDTHCFGYMSYGSPIPLFWRVEILHNDGDGNIFKTLVEVSRNGSITRWEKIHLDDDTE